MSRTLTVRIGLVLAALLALGDLSDIFQPDNPESDLMVAVGAILGLVTLIGAVAAWRGSRGGGVAVIVTRLLSGVGAFESFFVHGFTHSDHVATVIASIVTVAAVGLVARGWQGVSLRLG